MIVVAEVPLDKKRLHRELDKLNYTQKVESHPNKSTRSNTRYNFPNFNLSFFKYIFYLIALVALVYVIYMVAKNVKYGSKEVSVDSKIILGDAIPESEILRRTNLEQMLNSETDPKVRIRLIFLMVLQALVKNGLLDTKPSYTNGQYALFLKTKMDIFQFVKLTKVYEMAWFGYHETLESEVNKAKELKDEILRTI
jgi:hypothetical protein